MSNHWKLALIVNLSFFTMVSGSELAHSGEVAQLTIVINAESTQPAGRPVLFTLAVTNSSYKAYVYTGRHHSYLPGTPFLALITDDRGKAREAQMSNDRGGASAPGGSGGTFRLLHGQTLDVPVCIDPLEPGSYEIEVRESKRAESALSVKTVQPIKVVVKNDSELAKKWEAELVARIRKGERFAQHVAASYPTDSLIALLLQELLSDDGQVVWRAAFPLLRVKKLPDNSAALISKAMDKHPARVLADLAAKIGTDESLEPVIKLARTEQFRGGAVWALGSFRQEKAIQELRRFLNDENQEVQFRAAQRLSEREDPAALEVLLKVAHNPKNQWRMYCFEALLKYPNDSRIEPAIKSGLNDPDRYVRESAQLALRDLERRKKQKN